jgi:hypothetical protein
LFREPTYVVLVMRADSMFVAHPDTDYTHVCSQCGECVGIYPSTVRLMQQKRHVKLVCHVCHGPSLAPLVPGAENEIGVRVAGDATRRDVRRSAA